MGVLVLFCHWRCLLCLPRQKYTGGGFYVPSYSGSIDFAKEPAIPELLPHRAIGIGATVARVDVVKERRLLSMRRRDGRSRSDALRWLEGMRTHKNT